MSSLSGLLTEARNPASASIDSLPTEQMLGLMNDADAAAPGAVRAELPAIARSVDSIAARLDDGGRLFYIGAVRDRLEDLLRPGRGANPSTGVTDHLSNCEVCAAELAVMQTQAEALKNLKGPADVDVPASFYASVLRRIEDKKRNSIWYGLIMSPVSSRVVYASLTVALLLGSYLVTAEQRDGHLDGTAMIARNTHYDAPVFGDQAQQRDAVLTNFASH